MDTLFYAFAVLVFAAAILMTEGAYLWWSGAHGGGARRIARRLRIMSGVAEGESERVSILKQRRYCGNPALDAFLHRLRLANAIDRLLIQSGLRWSVAQAVCMSAAAMLGAFLLLQARLVPLPVQAVIVLAAGNLPFLLARRARHARLIKIEQQLPEAADFLARAMRAGHSFNNVLQMVGSELPEPLSGEFRMAHEEINYGVPMNEALYNLAGRIPLTDLRYLIIAVVIQRESGGNLAEILGNISYIIRQRLRLIAKVRVLSAEGRMSAWVLGLLPFFVMAFMLVSSYEYVSMLWTDPAGRTMMWISAGLLVAGALWIRRIVRIRV